MTTETATYDIRKCDEKPPCKDANEFIKEYRTLIFGILHKSYPSRIEDEDTQQVALIAAYRAFESYDGQIPFRYHLYKAIRCKSWGMAQAERRTRIKMHETTYKRLRKKIKAGKGTEKDIRTFNLANNIQSSPVPIEEIENREPQADRLAMMRELPAVIGAYLDQLSPVDSDVIRSLFGIGKSPESWGSLASRLGCSNGSIQFIRNRAINTLRQMLPEHYAELLS